jgi:7-cyano-7-deazaguanine synthase
VAQQNLIDTRPERALVLFSGGQDSTTCLAWALARFANVETVGFDYRQRHRVELDCRASVVERLRREFPEWNGKLGDDRIIDLGVLGEISDTALTGDTAIAFEQSGLPNTFVPGRNLLFFTSPPRSAIAAARGILSAACAKPIIRAIPIAATIP